MRSSAEELPIEASTGCARKAGDTGIGAHRETLRLEGFTVGALPQLFKHVEVCIEAQPARPADDRGEASWWVQPNARPCMYTCAGA